MNIFKKINENNINLCRFKPSQIKPVTTVVHAINESVLNKFIGQKILVETENKDTIGILGRFKNNYVLYKNNTVKCSLNLNEIYTISGKNKNTNLHETITICGSNKYCVQSKKGKNLGGPYKSKKQAVKRLKQVEYFKQMGENMDLLLRDRLRTLFFSEEIVNKDHKGRMTKGMQASRDKTASKLKNVKVIKGPPGRDDTPEEAKYRLATYIEWKKHKGK